MNRDQLNQVLTQFEATTEAIQGIEKKVERVNGYINAMHVQREVMTLQADYATGLVDKISDSLNERSDEILDYFQRTLETFADPVEQIEMSVLNMGLQTVPAKLHKEFGPMLVPAVFLVLILTVSNSVFGFLLAGDRRLATVLSLNAVYGQGDASETATAGRTVNILSIFAIFHVVMVGIAAAYVVIESCRKGFRRRRQRKMKGESVSWWDWDTFAKDFNILEEAGGLEEEQERLSRLTAKSKQFRGDGFRGSLDAYGGRWLLGEGGGQQFNTTNIRSQFVGNSVTSSNGRAVVARDAQGTRRAWVLPAGELATILDMDEMGNLRLLNPTGIESGWVQAEAFAGVTQTEGGEAIISSSSIGAFLNQVAGYRARLGSNGSSAGGGSNYPGSPQGRLQNLIRASSDISIGLSAGAEAESRGAGVGGLDLLSPGVSRPTTPTLQPLANPTAGQAVISVDEHYHQSPEIEVRRSPFFESGAESSGASPAFASDFNPFPSLLDNRIAAVNPGPASGQAPAFTTPERGITRTPSPLLTAAAEAANPTCAASPEWSCSDGVAESARTSTLQAPSTFTASASNSNLPRLPIGIEGMGGTISNPSATISPPTGAGSGSSLFAFPTLPLHSEAESGPDGTSTHKDKEGESGVSLGKRSSSSVDSRGNPRGKERPRISANKMGYSSSAGNSRGHTTPTAKASSTSLSSNALGTNSGQSQKTPPVSSMLRRLQEFSRQNIRSERASNSPSNRSQEGRRKRPRSRERVGGGTTPASDAAESDKGRARETPSPSNTRSL